MDLYKSKLCPHLERECVVLVPVKKDMVDKKKKKTGKDLKENSDPRCRTTSVGEMTP